MKKSTHRTFAAFLTVCMLLFTFVGTAFAADEDVQYLDAGEEQSEEVYEEGQSEETYEGETYGEEQSEEESSEEETEEVDPEEYGIELLNLGDGTYKIQISFTEDLDNVTVSLTGAAGTYAGSAVHLDAYDIIQIENVAAGQYTVAATATNANGEEVKGSETIYQAHFDYAEEDNTVQVEINNMVKDVNGAVTVGFSFSNPYPAKDGQNYPFDPENVNASLTGADGKEYKLVRDSNGYLSATVPANQPYTLKASGESYGRVDNSNLDESVKYSFELVPKNLSAKYFDTNQQFPVNVKKNEITVTSLTQKSYPVTFTVKDGDTGAAKVEITVVDPDGKKYTAVTDENGEAVIKFPTPDQKDAGVASYWVEAVAKDGRTQTATFPFDSLAGGMKSLDLTLPDVESFNAVANVYVNGELIGSNTVKGITKKKNNDSKVSAICAKFEGVATCTRVEAFRADGTTPVPVELLDVSTTTCGVAEVDKEYKASIENNETITVNFYYEYIDQDVEYKVSLTHVFTDYYGNEIYREREDYTFKSGDAVVLDQLRTNDENWVLRDLSGYRPGVGAWFVMGTLIEGGDASNPLIGSVDDNRGRAVPQSTMKFTMPHTDVDAAIYYNYSDRYIEYLANNSAATGSMYIDWAYSGVSKTIKPIDGENNGYQLANYHFIGWNTNADGSGTAYNPGDTVYVDRNMTLYAQWEIDKYTVTWVNEDGTVLEKDLEVPYGEMPSFDGTVPVKADDGTYRYTFAGWTPEVQPVTGDVTYTAVYKSELIPVTPQTDPTVDPTVEPTEESNDETPATDEQDKKPEVKPQKETDHSEVSTTIVQSSGAGSPDTGDNTPIVLYLLVFALAACAIVGAVIVIRKKKKD